MNLQRYNNYLLLVPGVLAAAALVALLMWPPKLGLDLAGGSLLQVTYLPTGQAGTTALPSFEQMQVAVAPLGLGEVRIQPTGESGYIVRARALSAEEKVSLEQAFAALGSMREDLFTSISPTIGSEILHKGLIALGLVALCIILFIAFAFRHVSEPVASWKYGIIAVISLLHDIVVPVGLFAILGHFAGAEVDSLFIVALLTILGISINDKIVIFDRIRENLRINADTRRKEPFDGVVGRSIVQTLARSINTSLTVIIVLLALYFIGPESTKVFALTLTIGMAAGTYSSILLACPLLVLWERSQSKK